MVSETIKLLFDADTSSAEGKLGGLKSQMAGIFGVGAVVGFAKQSVEAFSESEMAVSKLNTAVKGHHKNLTDVGSTNAEITKHFQEQASKKMEMSTYDDDALLVAQENYATFGLTGKEIDKMLTATMDYSAHLHGAKATGESMLTDSNALGKAVVNNASALVKSGSITKEQAEDINKIKDRHEKVEAITKAIKENYGGMAKNLSETNAGKIEKMKNEWGEIQESVGEKLLPYLVKTGDFLLKHLDTIIKVGEVVAGIWAISKVTKFANAGVEAYKKIGSQASKSLGDDIVAKNSKGKSLGDEVASTTRRREKGKSSGDEVVNAGKKIGKGKARGVGAAAGVVGGLLSGEGIIDTAIDGAGAFFGAETFGLSIAGAQLLKGGIHMFMDGKETQHSTAKHTHGTTTNARVNS